jgi:uncharacterized membrane protein YeaQ/YmgE (transglycosylase-associated protein family)
MGLVAWIVVGLIAGWLAGMVMKGSGFGVIGDIVLGIIGALLGGFLASTVLNIPNPLTGINFTSVLTAVVGAIIVVAIIRLLPRRRWI